MTEGGSMSASENGHTGGYTPGPWEYIDATKVAAMQYAPACVIKSGNTQISRFSWNDDSPWFPNKEESQANARLIAAAPEMLAALKAHDAYLLDAGYSGPDDDALHPKAAENWRNVRAAISKATGTA